MLAILQPHASVKHYMTRPKHVKVTILVDERFAKWLRETSKKRHRSQGFLVHEAMLPQLWLDDRSLPAPVNLPRGPEPF